MSRFSSDSTLRERTLSPHTERRLGEKQVWLIRPVGLPQNAKKETENH